MITKATNGFTLLRLIVILGILGILITIPGRIYNDYIAQAKISSLLSGIESRKLDLTEQIKVNKEIKDHHKIIINTDHIENNSMLVLRPIIVKDNVYWGCNRIGLSVSQVPRFCRLNDFTNPQININNEINCKINQGISYNETNKTFSVNIKINGEVVSIGNFNNIKRASEEYLSYLNI